jgi:predicted DNA-binding transcriptional regulator AlpA
MTGPKDAEIAPIWKQKLLLAAAEACEALSVSRKTLYLISQPRGPLPCVHLTKSCPRWPVAAIQEWIAKQGQEVANG